VFVSGLLSLWQLYSCYYALNLQDTKCKDDEEVTLGFANFIYIQMAFAFFNLPFLKQFQPRVVRRILKIAVEAGSPTQPLGERTHRQWRWQKCASEEIRSEWQSIDIKMEIVRQGVRETFLYDLWVLGYFIACIGIGVLSIISPNQITHMSTCSAIVSVHLNGIGFLVWALTYGLFVVIFWFFWWAEATVEVVVPSGPSSGPSGTSVGASSAV